MDLKINVQEDAELRAFVKDLIAGQVRAIIRDDIKELVAKEFSGTVKATLEKRFQNIMDSEMRETVRRALVGSAYGNISSDSPIFVAMQKSVNDHVKGYTKDFLEKSDKAVETLVVKGVVDKISKDDVIKFVVEKMAKEK